MTTAAWVTMIVTIGIVTTLTAYFFWKVLTTPPKDRKQDN